MINSTEIQLFTLQPILNLIHPIKIQKLKNKKRLDLEAPHMKYKQEHFQPKKARKHTIQPKKKTLYEGNQLQTTWKNWKLKQFNKNQNPQYNNHG